MKKIDVVCGIIKTEKGYLIGKRKSKVHDGVWEFPGGKVEEEETKEEALCRELKEELGIEVSIENFLCEIIDNREDCSLKVYAYLCSWKKGNLQLAAHHTIAFVQASELYDYNFEEADKGILDAVNAWERGKEHEEN